MSRTDFVVEENKREGPEKEETSKVYKFEVKTSKNKKKKN